MILPASDITGHSPARHGEAGPGHVHRLARHRDPRVAPRLHHAARVADGDLGPETRVPDLQFIIIIIIFRADHSPEAGRPC